MNRIANSIKNRLSLRPPQEESLNILAGLMDRLVLQKNCDLSEELEKVTNGVIIIPGNDYRIVVDKLPDSLKNIFRASNI